MPIKIEVEKAVTRNLERYPDDLQPWGAHASGLTIGGDGTVLVSWYGGTCRGVHEETGAVRGDPLGASRVYLARLLPGADVFSDPVVLGGNGSLRHMDANLFTDSKGTIHSIYVKRPPSEDWIWTRRALDSAGTEWGEEALVSPGINGRVMNPPIEVDGRLLLPVSSFDKKSGPWRDGQLLVSADGGVSWQQQWRFEARDLLVSLREPSIVQWQDKLLMFFRVRVAQNFWEAAPPEDPRWRVFRSVSSDGGQNWTEPLPVGLPNFDCKVNVIQLDDGRLLIAYNDKPERWPLKLATSDDGGVNWAPLGDIDPGPGEMSYPTMLRAADGKIHISYTHQRRDIFYKVFRVE